MSGTNSKIQAVHWQRSAYVYIRQSSPQQVKHNLESQRRQYALRERAVVLGWEPGAVVVVDEDQGRSGQDEERAGFQRLQRAVACGEVGVLFNLEVSRLSRQSSAWAALIEVCRWQQTLLGDEENLYDPNLADDRLLLGLRGLLGEVELETLRQRMQVSREEKARRGELRFHPPTGLVWDGGEGFRRDPDEEVQGAVHLLFEQFRRLGSAAAVVRSFGEEGLLFPTRHFGGVREEEVEWQPLTYLRTLQVLHNPLYAGAYAYGRRAYSRSRKPRERWGQRGVGLAEEEWLVVQWEAFPGYVSREEYEANQRRLAANQPRGEEGGAVREGEALLSGRVLCGRCGQRMQVAYAGTGGRYPVYVCRPGRKEGQNRVCQQVSAAGVDRKVVEAVLEALTPAAVEVSLEVVEEVAQQQALLRQQWERRVERVRYEAALAERRYRQVEPENRLVARTLEREWEERLQAVAQTEQEYQRVQREAPLRLGEEERAGLLALAQDLRALWEAESTPLAERKEVLRLLIADVTLTRQEGEVLVQLRWVTNEMDTWTAPVPERGARTDPAVLERLRERVSTHTDEEIATDLNEAGLRTARGELFTADRVSELRRTHQIVKERGACQAHTGSKVQ